MINISRFILQRSVLADRAAALRSALVMQSMTEMQRAIGYSFGIAGIGVSLAASLLWLGNLNADRLHEQNFSMLSQTFSQTSGLRHGSESAYWRAKPDYTEALGSFGTTLVEASYADDQRLQFDHYLTYRHDGAALNDLLEFDIKSVAVADEFSLTRQCMAEAIYYEARSESSWGQMAVAEVVMNRVKDYRYPDSVCEVVYQGSERRTGCQFSFTCDGSMNSPPQGRLWQKSQIVANHVLMDLNKPRTRGATHYHATYVDPVWNSGLIKTNHIGEHIFYRFPRGGEWAVARARVQHRLGQVAPGMSALQTSADQQATKPMLLKAATSASQPAETSVIVSYGNGSETAFSDTYLSDY